MKTVIRNGRIVWNNKPYCYYFGLNLKYFRWSYREYIKTARSVDFCEELLSEIDFEAVLVTFCCYEHSANASEEFRRSLQIKKIITNAPHVL